MHLLLIEDDARLTQLLDGALKERGLRVDVSRDLAGAEEALRGSDYDAIVLDIGLPDGDGLGWLRRQRALSSMVPVLVLTGRSTLVERVTGLEAGADDYLTKPFELDELVARLRALARRPRQRTPAMLAAGNLALDVFNRLATVADSPLEITKREGELLELLLRRPGRLLRRTTIESSLYGLDEAVTPNAVEVLVSRLRRKLQVAGADVSLLTVRGLGYRLGLPKP